MATHDPYEDVADADEKYHESSDEDFNPAAAAASDESSSSASEDEGAAVKPAKGKRKRKVLEPDELDSGDEITIEAAQRGKAKRRKGAKADEDDLLLSDDEGGEGGLIKTRAQRRVEQRERRPLAGIEGATIDVDAIWAQMSAAPLRPVRAQPKPLEREVPESPSLGIDGVQRPAQVEDENDLVAVRKTYTFAGQDTTEEKQVPRSSLEQYLKDGWKSVDEVTESPAAKEADQDGAEQGVKLHRPLRRPSRFDPNPTGYVRALPPEHQLTWPRKRKAESTADQENVPVPEAPRVIRPEKAQKLNVVDKSRLDWTGFVDKEGIAEELDVHGKTKEAYLGRMEFLASVEARREEERRRLKATAS